MSNTRKLRGHKKARRCPKCHSGKIRAMNYPDAMLYICNACSYPVREVKSNVVQVGGLRASMYPRGAR